MDETAAHAAYLSATGEEINLTFSNGFLGNCSSIESYERLNAIGEGAYGLVSRARDKRSGTVVAVKQVRILDDERHNGIPITTLREISILRSLRHQNVINVYEVAVDDHVLEDVYVVMEYCEQDLASLLDGHRVHFSLGEVKCLAKQLLEGLEYLHRKNIIHRDIKLENLLLNGNGVLKIADFGMAREFSPRPLTPGVVTIWYRAPELLLGTSHYTLAVDLWAVGLFIGELILQMPVLDGQDDMEQLSQIVKLIGSPAPEDLRTLTAMGCPSLIRWQREDMPRGRADNLERKFLSKSNKETVSFLSGLLRWDPKARWTASEALGKSRNNFVADAEAWWRGSPRAVEKERLPKLPEKGQRGESKTRKRSEEQEDSTKRQHVDERASGGEAHNFVFDFGDAEPATKHPPRKRRR